MQIIKASAAQLEIVQHIVHETIRVVFPRYYPSGAVDYFLLHHSKQAILTDIDSGFVYLLFGENGQALGTGSVKENEIHRLFVFPAVQHQGYGCQLMHFLERQVFESYDTIYLASSLAALAFYRSRGYTETEFYKIVTGNGDFLCYHMMQLKRQETACPEKQDEISYDGKSFVTMRNSTNGEAGEKTRFCYHQSDRHIWAEYSGGGIVKGFLAGFVQRDGSLEFSYVHTNDMGNIRAGECKSYPEILSDGRLTLHESWQWLNGDKSFGKSQLTEVSNA